MKTLYLDCGMGAAGDMLTAALLELLPDPKAFIDELNGLGIPGVVFEAEPSVKCGITGTHMKVTVGGEEEESLDHHHDHEHHEHDHGEDHEHAHDHDHGEDHEHEHDHDHDHGEDHVHEHHHHDHELCADGCGGHEHHEHPHDHDHSHEHDHEHHHDHDHSHHHHSGIHDIEHIVRDHMNIPERVADHVMAVYGLIAEAESHAHGVPVDQIHFHEVGTMDAVADVTAVCLLMDRLAPDRVVVSPVHVGSGQVRCAHGILPVPAPATAFILKDVPIYGGAVRGELCTPTGAALLKHFATSFGPMPVMRVSATGYGMGKKDFEAANCVRAMIGESEGPADQVFELSCNVDDMTGEAVGFAMERLFEAGALDVYTVPIGMKKSRPGLLIRAMCRAEKKDAVIEAMFRHTTTIGIRENAFARHVLNRRIEEVETGAGTIRRKVSEGFGVVRTKLEHDDLARIAAEKGISLAEAAELAGKR